MAWTKQQYDAYQARRASQSPKSEPSVCHESLAAAGGEAEHPARVRVGIRSFRTRLLDPDNLCPKYFIDCLRYAGLIKDDSPEFITIEITQEKVRTKKEERTEIELT